MYHTNDSITTIEDVYNLPYNTRLTDRDHIALIEIINKKDIEPFIEVVIDDTNTNETETTHTANKNDATVGASKVESKSTVYGVITVFKLASDLFLYITDTHTYIRTVIKSELELSYYQSQITEVLQSNITYNTALSVAEYQQSDKQFIDVVENNYGDNTYSISNLQCNFYKSEFDAFITEI